MIKKIITFMAVFCLWLSTAHALSYQNQPKGHEGVLWGSSLEQTAKKGITLELLKTNDKTGEKIYKKSGDDKKLYGTTFDSVTWHFIDNRLFMVKAVKNNDANIHKMDLTQSLQRRHGKNTQLKENLYQKTSTLLWPGDDTYISLLRDYKNKRAILKIYNYRLDLLNNSRK